MNKKDQEVIYKRALGTYGDESQMDMAIEECSELIKAICKLRRTAFLKQSPDYAAILETRCDDIRDELVDVQIMIDQLKIIFTEERDFEYVKEIKILRLDARLIEENLKRKAKLTNEVFNEDKN